MALRKLLGAERMKILITSFDLDDETCELEADQGAALAAREGGNNSFFLSTSQTPEAYLGILVSGSLAVVHWFADADDPGSFAKGELGANDGASHAFMVGRDCPMIVSPPLIISEERAMNAARVFCQTGDKPPEKWVALTIGDGASAEPVRRSAYNYASAAMFRLATAPYRMWWSCTGQK